MGSRLEAAGRIGSLRAGQLYWYTCMRFSVDAHAIGRHLTGNEVYVRNLLRGFAALDQTSDFIAYLSNDVNGAAAEVPERFIRRPVAANSFVRLGLDLSRKL